MPLVFQPAYMADPNRGRRQLLIVVGGVAAAFSLSLAGAVWLRGGEMTIVRQLAPIVIFLGLADLVGPAYASASVSSI